MAMKNEELEILCGNRSTLIDHMDGEIQTHKKRLQQLEKPSQQVTFTFNVIYSCPWTNCHVLAYGWFITGHSSKWTERASFTRRKGVLNIRTYSGNTNESIDSPLCAHLQRNAYVIFFRGDTKTIRLRTGVLLVRQWRASSSLMSSWQLPVHRWKGWSKALPGNASVPRRWKFCKVAYAFFSFIEFDSHRNKWCIKVFNV